MTIKKIFKIKFASATDDTAETSIKNHLYRYITPNCNLWQ
jgi:hypothetical protein